MSGKVKFFFICFILSILSFVTGTVLFTSSANDEVSLWLGTVLLVIGALLLFISIITAIIGWKRFAKYLYALTALSASVEAGCTLILSDDIVTGLIYLAVAILLLIGMVPICFKKS
ncbi:MAG: hypothetical protein IJX92_04255 [Clostridia bacterium]|nr:hypothetical protein [Clostridia bacterium]